jgi:S1-C subfamily serine protease
MFESFDETSTGRSRLQIATLALALVAIAISGASFFLLASDRAALQADLAVMEKQVDALSADNESVANRLGNAESRLKRKETGVAGLAAHALKSVFTVEASGRFGSGFVAWMDEDSTYVLTAHHVVEGTLTSNVTLKRKGSGWQGEIAGVDPAHDLALIRMNGRPKGIEPLWQQATTKPPAPGDQLLLIGSPFGLEGTVTSGVVSRVTKKEIQTDAAANPGNSGGPAIDRRGRVVGVLVAGGGQNVNFAIPIARVCAKLRHCG